MAKIVIIDDEEAIGWALKKAFERAGHTVEVTGTVEAGLPLVTKLQPAVLFLDIRLPGMDGLTSLSHVKAKSPDTATVVMTAHGNLDTAVRALAGGAFDYLAKPFDLSAAQDAISRALARKHSAVDSSTTTGPEFVGVGPAMQSVFKRIALVAPTNAAVLVTGESGTGKELVARAIHQNSPRKAKPFLPIHIAALNPNVVESELFGHAKGAFTGADRQRPGLFELANGGTAFLDELADIPLPIQAKLLRVLERQEVFPVGGTEPTVVNVRLISATNANLALAVKEGRFREDLFYRLNVYPIHLPPLRERQEDLPVLAQHLLQTIQPGMGPLPEETLAYLRQRQWVGNVRELRNALEHASIEARGGPLLVEHFPPPLSGLGQDTQSGLQTWVKEWLRQELAKQPGAEPANLYEQFMTIVEPALLNEVLLKLNGNRLAAARWLGIARGTVRKILAKSGTSIDDEE